MGFVPTKNSKFYHIHNLIKRNEACFFLVHVSISGREFSIEQDMV